MRNKVAHKKRVLVTGASGFIGSHVTRAAIAVGHHVFIAVRDVQAKTPENTHKVFLNFSDVKQIASALPDVDTIIHLGGRVQIDAATKQPADTIMDNVTGTLNLLEALRVRDLHPLVVFASTDRQYGRIKTKTATEASAPFPIEPYTASKMMCETLLQTYSHLYGIPHIIFRIDSVYGPGQPREMFISDVIQKILTQDEITVGNLKVLKNFVFVEDVARAFMCAVAAPKSAHNLVYNIGGASATLGDLLAEIKKIINTAYNKNVRVTSAASVAQRAGFEVQPFKLSTARAAKNLGWKTNVPLKQGLTRTIEYFYATLNKKNK